MVLPLNFTTFAWWLPIKRRSEYVQHHKSHMSLWSYLVATDCYKKRLQGRAVVWFRRSELQDTTDHMVGLMQSQDWTKASPYGKGKVDEEQKYLSIAGDIIHQLFDYIQSQYHLGGQGRKSARIFEAGLKAILWIWSHLRVQSETPPETAAEKFRKTTHHQNNLKKTINLKQQELTWSHTQSMFWAIF